MPDLALREKSTVARNVYQLTFDRPEDLSFAPGQATDLSLMKTGWLDEQRPFTFTSLPDQDHLEFIIKSYPSHEGVTEQIGDMNVGDVVRIGEAWGAIADKGPGTFIAGGAGVTPFIALLRDRARKDALKGCTLIFANETEKDIILRDELEQMTGLRVVHVLASEKVDGLSHGQIDADLLEREVEDWTATFYVCGPPPMEEAVTNLLKERDVPADRIVTEE